MAPSSASAVDAATRCRIVQSEWTAPFKKMGLPSISLLARKKCPPTVLRACGSFIYKASECS
eukprot:13620814-Ditylum_brightwellii.AAC.1